MLCRHQSNLFKFKFDFTCSIASQFTESSQNELSSNYSDVHKGRLDADSTEALAAEFAGMAETCRAAFSRFSIQYSV
jgi:hypothetical protein